MAMEMIRKRNMSVEVFINIKERCSRCWKSSPITDFETGEMFCGDCGFVLSERVEDSGPERHSFSDDKIDRGRTGSGVSLARHDQGLSTIISPINKDASGKPLSALMKNTFKRLRTWNDRSQVYEPVDRNLRQAFNELNKLKDKLTLSDAVMERAAYIYRKALENKLVRGRSISAMIASALYAACRDTETPRTLNDVAEAGNTKRKDVARCYRLLFRELDLKMPVVDPIHCIARIASRLEITEKTKRYAVRVLKISQEHEESAGKDPMGLAAAALYLACVKNGEEMTQRNIAEASNVTEVTIRNRSKSLRLDQHM
ncbi:MAG: putative transcription initiation factor [Nitrosarchaeum sp.]|nr:putative transcription initiation factor [Nitrosarchaeum sp.]